MRGPGIALALAIVIAAPLQAAVCTAQMTPQQCFDQFLPPVPRAGEGAADANKELAKANTGTTGLASPSGSALRDFLALFAASVESATLKDSANAVTLDWNLPFPPLGDGRPLKIQAVVTNPDLNSDLVKALGTNADAISTLRGGLPESGDVSVSATLSPVNAKFGRALGPHRALLSALLNDAEDRLVSDDAARAFTAALAVADIRDAGSSFDSQVQANIKRKCEPLAGEARTKCTDDTTASGQRALAAVENMGRLQKAQRDALVKNAIDPFVRLLNNQPQFYATALEHARDKLVGPNETSAKVTYEIPFAPNLNTFYAGDGRSCTPGAAIAAARAADCATKLRALAGTTPDATNSQSRLAIAAEYHELAKTDINLTQYTVKLQKPGSHSFSGSLTFGYVLDTKGDVTKSDRIDVSVTYENVSGDPLKKDRGIGSLTFTKKLSDTMTFPISLVYANHARYLSTVDRKLNVHFGLVYKMPK